MRVISALLIVLIWVLPTFAAININGVSFTERRQLDDVELRLTGTALLTWALFVDVYAGAFYLPKGHPGSHWADDVPKRLELSYFRSFKAEDFSRASDTLLRDSLPPAQYQALAERLEAFYLLFGDIESGDRYSLNYSPGKGTELHLNGTLLGIAPGHDFAVAYFGIWLGEQPLNKNFRDQLLKKSERSSEDS